MNLTINYPSFTQESATSCGAYFWNGNSYTTSGVYTYTTQGSNGCDSTVKINLTILPRLTAPVVYATQPVGADLFGSITITDPIITGYNYSINGINYQASNVFNNVIPGIYYVTVKNSNNCVSSSTLIYINAITQSSIYHTSTSCNDFKSGRGEEVDQLCYTSTGNIVTNVTPGMIYYYAMLTAPSSNFCIDVIQNRTDTNFSKLSIHQFNQIKLLDARCMASSLGVTVTPGNGRVCISNATIGATYVLSVKYNPKSAIGSSYFGVAPEVLYGFKCQINGETLPGTETSVKLKPNCNSDRPDVWLPVIVGNPTSSSLTLSVTTDVDSPVSISVLDVMGRQVSQFKIQPNNNYNYGNELKRGVYFIEFVQGDKKKIIKAIKL